MRKKRILAPALAAACVAALGAGAQQSRTQRVPQLENEAVRVWKTVIQPRQPLSMHRHEHGRVIVVLRGGTLKIVKQSGEARSVTWESGKAYWLGADPPSEVHGDVNEGSEPIEVMVVELKREPR